KPVGQSLQIPSERREAPHLLATLTTLSRRAHRRHDQRLADIEPRATLHHHFHHDHLLLGSWKPPTEPSSKEGETRAQSNNPGCLKTPTSWCDSGSKAPIPLDVNGRHTSFTPPGRPRRGHEFGVTSTAAG